MAKSEWYCAFCGKKRSEAKRLIQGPCVCICDGCVELCVKILQEMEHVDRVKRFVAALAESKNKGEKRERKKA